MKTKSLSILVATILSLGFLAQAAESLTPDLQAKVDAKIKAVQTWATDAAIVDAVKAQNANPPAEYAGLNQDKWKALTILDPLVRGLSKNAAAEFLKGKKDEAVSEAFLSSADGTKVAFLAKTSNWSHKGKAKHDEPMAGKTWQGSVEVDESTGLQQLQIAVPVLDGGKPIGSLVVGLSLAKLKG